MIKLLVTGGSGLIGGEFISQYYDIINIISFDKKQPHQRFPEVQYIVDDLENIQKYREQLSDLDGVIHLAAVSRVITAEKEPLETWRNNVWLTTQFLQFLEQISPHPWIIFGSSREVFGESHILPVSDKQSPQPINIYGKTKLVAENLIELYTLRNQVSTLALRFSNVYGSINDYKDRVIPKFIVNAITEKPLEVHGFENLFDFTHVLDTVIAIKQGVEYLQKQSKPIHQRLLICTNQGTSLKDLAQIIINLTGSKSKIQMKKARTYDVQRFYGDYSAAKQLIGYKPQIMIKEGLSKFISLISQSEWLY